MPTDPTPTGPGPTDPEHDKHRARTEARARLASLTPFDAAERSRLICDRLWGLESARAARAVFVYLSAGPAEPDLLPFVHMLRGRCPSALICAPRVDWDAGTMHPLELRFGTDNKPQVEIRRHGIPEPAGGPQSAPVPPSRIDLIMVPGVAFDPRMGRLGRGGGFYDRWLSGPGFAPPSSTPPTAGGKPAQRPRIVGVCYDEQVADRVPAQAHDVRMDAIATDRRLLTP